MPVIIIHGLPADTDQKLLENFFKFIRQKVAGIEELKIVKEQVSVFFPQSLMSKGSGEEIIIFVEDLFERPERTEYVKKKLAKELVDVAHLVFPKTTLIECIVRSLDPKQGFCSGKIQEDGLFLKKFD